MAAMTPDLDLAIRRLAWLGCPVETCCARLFGGTACTPNLFLLPGANTFNQAARPCGCSGISLPCSPDMLDGWGQVGLQIVHTGRGDICWEGTSFQNGILVGARSQSCRYNIHETPPKKFKAPKKEEKVTLSDGFLWGSRVYVLWFVLAACRSCFPNFKI